MKRVKIFNSASSTKRRTQEIKVVPIYQEGRQLHFDVFYDDRKVYGEMSAAGVIDVICELHDRWEESKRGTIESSKITASLDFKRMQDNNLSSIAMDLVEEYYDQDNRDALIDDAVNQIITEDYRDVDPDEDIDSQIKSMKEKLMRKIKVELDWQDEVNADSSDVMEGHLYQVSGSSPNVTETGTDYSFYGGKYFDTPEEAIKEWLKLSKKAPTCISIDTNKIEAAQELLNWVAKHEDEFEVMCDRYHCPYRVDFMIAECKKGFRGHLGKYPDQIYPFALG